MSDARIDSVLQEERQFSPPPDFARRARIKSAADLNALHARAAADHAGFWAALARGDKTAIIFEGEPGDTRRLSYRELHQEVCRFANALKGLGVTRGDRVVIYMPMIPEAVIAMQACARIGAIHSVVFGGFSAESLKDRIEDAGAKLLITADGGHRGGRIVELNHAADKALSHGCATIEQVIVYRRTDHKKTKQTNHDEKKTDHNAEHH